MKTLSRSFVIVIVLLSTTNFFAQENKKLDSLLRVYNNSKTVDSVKFKTAGTLFRYYMVRDLELAEKYLSEEKKLAEALDSDLYRAKAIIHHGNLFHFKELNDSAEFYYEKGLNYYKNIKDTLNTAYVQDNVAGIAYKKGDYKKAERIFLNNISIYRKLSGESYDVAYNYGMLARVLFDQGYYRRSLEYNYKSIKILKEKQSAGLSEQLYQLALVEAKLENYDKAIETNLEARQIFESDENVYFLGQIDLEIGKIYYELQNYDKSKARINSALASFKATNNSDFEGDSYETLGRIQMQQDQYDKAIVNLNKALTIHEKIDVALRIIRTNMYLGELYHKIQKPQLALNHLNTAIQLGEKSEINYFLAHSYELRAKVYNYLNQKSNALDDYVAYHKLSESILNTSKSKQIEELRTIYDLEKKEQQIVLQEKDIVVLEQEAKISDQQKLLLGGGMALSLVALGFGFYGFRQKTKRNKLEKDKVEAELEFKKKELTTHALHLAKKNEVLENVKLKAKDLKSKGDAKGYQELIKTITFDQQDDKNWESFTRYFEQVHKNFASDVKHSYPDVTKNELRFMALLKMNMSSKEIATILNISPDGIKKARQRLRKKMGLRPDDSLENTVLAI